MSNIKVTVTINRPIRESKLLIVEPEVRYGMFSRPEDEDVSKPRPELLFFDLSARLHTRAINSYYAYEYLDGIMAYLTAYDDFSTSNPVQLTSGIDDDLSEFWRNWLQPQAFETLDFTYRKPSKVWPLPFDGAGILGATIKLGSKTTELDHDPNWKAEPTPQERFDATPDTPENADLRDAIQKEIDENSLPNHKICEDGIDETLHKWYVHNVQDIRPLFYTPGRFKSSIRANLKTLKFGGSIHYEPFDLSKRSEFIITKRLIDDDHVPTYVEALANPAADPEVQGRNAVKIYLVPRTWRCDLAYLKIYGTHPGGGDPGVYDPPAAGSASFYFPAITNALVLQGSINTDFLALPTPVLSRIFVKSSTAWDKTDLSLDNYLVLCSRVGGYFSFIDTDDLTNLWGRYNTIAEITIKNTQAGKLVAALETKDDDKHRYFIFRKTELVLTDEEKAIYSGQFDDPRYVSNELVTSGYNLNQSYLTSFSTFDPDNAPLSFFGAWIEMTSFGHDFCDGSSESGTGGFPYFMELKTGLAVHNGL